MKKTRVFCAVVVGALVLMGASECNLGGRPSNESCNITARDTEKIYMKCTNEDGKVRDADTQAPSDLYPKCQVGTYWPGCKSR